MAQLMLFAGLREAAGRSRDQIQAATVEELIEQARIRYGESFRRLLDHSSVAVNGVLIEALDGRATLLEEEDEVALLPPVSGGSRLPPVRRGLSSPGNPATVGLLLIGVVLTSLVGVWVLAGFVAMVSAVAAAATLRHFTGLRSRSGIWLAAAASAAFPLAVAFFAEGGLLWALSLAVLAVGSRLVVANAVEGSVREVGVSLWLALYFGFSMSFSVLIRHSQNGVRLLAAIAIMIVLYKVAVRLAGIGSADSTNIAGTCLTPKIVLVGLAASVAGALVALTFLASPFTIESMIVLGLIVGVASLLGEATSSLIASDLSGSSETSGELPIFMALDSALLALPAVYYGFRLYVT